ncbi:MAG TPA: disulfide oxidoreductase [Microthrixaceae bacterium]|nr:disulfide oxidoreductase [Microthrixaceae bacterium]
MSVETVTTFFALLAVLGIFFLVAVACSAIFASARGGLPASLQAYRDSLGSTGLILGFAVALTCMLGSLYLSEVAKFPPCELCWFQRIAMYPLVVIMGVAALRRDHKVAIYSVPLTVIGLGISTYHYLVERFPDNVGYACNTDVPCSTVWVWKFHFLSIPAMAGIGFMLVGTFSMLAMSVAKTSSSKISLKEQDSE